MMMRKRKRKNGKITRTTLNPPKAKQLLTLSPPMRIWRPGLKV